MSNEVVWKGETRNFCTCCGAIFAAESVIRRSSRGDDVWRIGAPTELGDYWVILKGGHVVPVVGEVFVSGNEEVLKLGEKEAPLNQMTRNVLYHRTYVLPAVPEAFKMEEKQD